MMFCEAGALVPSCRSKLSCVGVKVSVGAPVVLTDTGIFRTLTPFCVTWMVPEKLWFGGRLSGFTWTRSCSDPFVRVPPAVENPLSSSHCDDPLLMTAVATTCELTGPLIVRVWLCTEFVPPGAVKLNGLGLKLKFPVPTVADTGILMELVVPF